MWSGDMFIFKPVFLQHGSVPLGVAAARGHDKTVKKLLELGANINQQTKVNIEDIVIFIMSITFSAIRLDKQHCLVLHYKDMWQ